MEEFLKPFYQAADNVFETMFQTNIKAGLFQAHENYINTHEANINIGVTGDLTGSVIYSFSKEFALTIATMMAGMEFEELNEFVGSTVGELANIISGNAMTMLAEYNYLCDIVPPEVFLGLNKSIVITNSSIITIPIKTNLGDFDINVSVKTR
ncbi:MAG: chemotaxis protein CheX [Halanaerobiaceae bacterium]